MPPRPPLPPIGGVWNDAPPAQSAPMPPQRAALPPIGGVWEDAPVQQPNFRTSNARDTSGRPMVGDVAIGAAKGLANTVVGLGEMVHYVPGVSRVVDSIYGTPGLSSRSFDETRRELAPTNTAQRVGFAAEQLGEFFVPGATVGRAANVVKSGLHTLAQTGSLGNAGVSGAITAVLPGAGAAQRAATSLRAGAEKEMARALGATKELMKDEAATLAPQMLRGVKDSSGNVLVKGVRGSREAMLVRAESESARVGAELESAYASAAAAGEAVDSKLIKGGLELAADALKIPNAKGKLTMIPGTESIVKTLERTRDWVGTLGPQVPVDKAASIKRVWDDVASGAGLFGSKASASSTDKAKARALNEGADSIRSLLNTNPTIEALNKEASFWIGLRKVLDATQGRTQAQGAGLTGTITGAAAMASGFASGDGSVESVFKGAVTGLVGKQLVQTIQSPAFRTQVSGPLKDKLAEALASGSTSKILTALAKIAPSLPGQARAATVTR